MVSNLYENGLMSEIYGVTHYKPISRFSTPWKRQKTRNFLTFLGAVEMEHWSGMGCALIHLTLSHFCKDYSPEIFKKYINLDSFDFYIHKSF